MRQAKAASNLYSPIKIQIADITQINRRQRTVRRKTNGGRRTWRYSTKRSAASQRIKSVRKTVEKFGQRAKHRYKTHAGQGEGAVAAAAKSN